MKKHMEELHFSVDARLVAQLGSQLVPSDVTALAELVKNAYDADATTALVDYYPDRKPSCLVIEDDGNGMTLEDVRRGWMIIGTPIKESSVTSPVYKRARTGRKGIGRFAAQRLGKRLVLYSTTKGSDTAIEIDFDWSKFISGTTLDKIRHDMRLIPAELEEHSTRLTISSLEEVWTEEKLKEVLEELIRIQAPPDSSKKRTSKDPGFSVVASKSGSLIKQDIDEIDLLRDESTWSVHGKIDKNGNGSYEFRFNRPKGKSIREPIKGKLSTGPLEFTLDIFTYSSKWLERLGVSAARELGKRYGGCRIWRDRFRVFPYGEQDDDWLGLDAHVGARRHPLTMPRNMQVLGGVRITAKNNPDFVDLISRRGLLDNQAFRDLRKFIFEGLRIGATEHGALAAKQSRGGPARSKPSEATLREVEKARIEREARHKKRVAELEETSSKEAVSQKEIDIIKKTLVDEEAAQKEHEERIVQVVEESERELLDENSMLKVLASLGTGLATFAHELRTIGNSIGIAKQEIEKRVKECGVCPLGLPEKMHKSLTTLKEGLNDLADYRKYIDDFIVAGSRRKRISVEMEPYIKNLLRTFSSFLSARSISPVCQIPRALFIVPVHRAELNSIIFNLLTNAVKAMLVPGIKERKLLFKGSKVGKSIHLIVADTGCGIPSSIADRLFDPFVSRTHVHDDVLGQGTGLGLTIAKDILNTYEGSIAVVKPPKSYNTAFVIRIPAKEK